METETPTPAATEVGVLNNEPICKDTNNKANNQFPLPIIPGTDINDLTPFATEIDWKQFVIDSTKKIQKPEAFLIQTSTGIALFHNRNISNTAAAMKVGKTKQNIAFITAILHPEGYLDFHCPISDVRVLFGDTEQDASDTMEFVNGVNKCLGKPENTILDNFKALNLREVLKSERAQYIEAAIIDFKPHFCIIDGIVDLCNDFNSIADSSATVEMFTAWASKYNCHIHTNIHVNKGANNQETRGHLGQILRQKGEVTILLTKKIDTVNYVEAKIIDSRHRPIDEYFFRINNDGLPETFQPIAKEPKADVLREIINKCYEGEKYLRYAELTLKLMEHGKVKIDAAKKKIQKAVKDNLIYKNEVELYCLRVAESDTINEIDIS